MMACSRWISRSHENTILRILRIWHWTSHAIKLSAVCETGLFAHEIHLPYVKQGFLHTGSSFLSRSYVKPAFLHTGFTCRVWNTAFYTREHHLLPGLIHRCHPLPGKLISYIEIFYSYWVSIKWKIVLLHPDSMIQDWQICILKLQQPDKYKHTGKRNYDLQLCIPELQRPDKHKHTGKRHYYLR